MDSKANWNEYSIRLIYGNTQMSFEEKLLLFSTLFISLLSLVFVFANVMMSLSLMSIGSVVIGFVVFFILYLILRLKSRPKIMYFITSLLMLLYFDLGWFLNGGSNGPFFQFLIVLFSVIILLFQRKYYLYFTLFLIANVVVLYVIEYYLNFLVVKYPNEQSRLFDNYFSCLVCILVVLAILSAIKKNYIHEYERAKKSDQLKSAFLANMSHEIRTPLNAIVGFSSLIVDKDIEESDKKEFLNHILHNSDNLLNLIGDIVDISKIESDQFDLSLEQINVVPALNEIVNDFQNEYQSSDKITIVNTLKMPVLILNVNEPKFIHVFRHLISNAVKFTEKGTVEVGCRLEDKICTFWVKDSGIGILPEHRDEIFNRFMKLENTRHHLYRGTGIGLFLSKELVVKMGGKIWVDSEYGKGSTFYISFPM